MKRPRVLLVEDEFLIRLTLADALADEGCEVLEAGTGDEALTVLDNGTELALLITDVRLPGGVDGLRLAHAARSREPALPVLFMTGRPDLVESRPAGSREAVISKPYLPSDLCSAARRLLAE